MTLMPPTPSDITEASGLKMTEEALAARFARDVAKDLVIEVTSDLGYLFQLALIACAPVAGEQGRDRHVAAQAYAVALMKHLQKPHVKVLVARVGNHVQAGLWIDEHGKSPVHMQGTRQDHALGHSINRHYLETAIVNQPETVH